MKSFLGRGFNFPLRASNRGSVEMSVDEDNVQQSILLILGTAKGERVYRVEFGCAIHDLVFAPNTRSTAARIESAVKDSLTRFEPRIKDLEVQAESDGDQENLINVNISYVVRALNKRENMVYPFYLRREGDL